MNKEWRRRVAHENETKRFCKCLLENVDSDMFANKWHRNAEGSYVMFIHCLYTQLYKWTLHPVADASWCEVSWGGCVHSLWWIRFFLTQLKTCLLRFRCLWKLWLAATLGVSLVRGHDGVYGISTIITVSGVALCHSHLTTDLHLTMDAAECKVPLSFPHGWWTPHLSSVTQHEHCSVADVCIAGTVVLFLSRHWLWAPQLFTLLDDVVLRLYVTDDLIWRLSNGTVSGSGMNSILRLSSDCLVAVKGAAPPMRWGWMHVMR